MHVCMQLSDFLDAGITTAVGVLGTDTVTRSQVRLELKTSKQKTW